MNSLERNETRDEIFNKQTFLRAATDLITLVPQKL